MFAGEALTSRQFLVSPEALTSNQRPNNEPGPHKQTGILQLISGGTSSLSLACRNFYAEMNGGSPLVRGRNHDFQVARIRQGKVIRIRTRGKYPQANAC